MEKADVYRTFCGFDVHVYPLNYGLDETTGESVIEERIEVEVAPNVHIDLTEISRDEAVRLIRRIIQATNGGEHDLLHSG